MPFAFLGALLGEHGKKFVQEATDKMVDMDPATASAAQLHLMEQNLDEILKKFTTIKESAAREHAELAPVQARFDRLRAAAATLNDQFDAETDPAKKAELSTSLNGLLSTLEGVKTELDQHKSSTAEADALVADTEALYKQKSQALLAAKTKLAGAARELETAHIAQDRANERAEQAAELAGLRNNASDGLNAAFNSMQRQAADARADAEAKKLKADVLTHVDTGGLDDPNVKAALAAVDNAPSSQSFADRLAALH